MRIFNLELRKREDLSISLFVKGVSLTVFIRIRDFLFVFLSIPEFLSSIFIFCPDL